jgi:GntR family phosphonate transport system transcriptional regulator
MTSPLLVRRGDGVAAWRQVAERLEAEIAGGDHAPAGRLPSEVLLAERMGVNRHTVRRAIAFLAERGIVRAARGSGTYVEPLPLRYPIGPRTRFSENAARAGREAWGVLASAATVPAEGGTAETLGVAPGDPVLRLATVHEADGVPISTAVTWLPLPRFEGFDHAYAAAGSITRAFAAYGVADYLRLSTRITARVADAEEAALLGLAPGRVLLVVDSVNVDADAKPIQATRACFAADRVELVVEG